jgi:hypothetical protein
VLVEIVVKGSVQRHLYRHLGTEWFDERTSFAGRVIGNLEQEFGRRRLEIIFRKGR